MELPLVEKDSSLADQEAPESLDTKLGEEVLMVAAVSGQEQESETLPVLSPRSHKRERKKNPRYSDYEMEEKPETQSPKQKRLGRPPKKRSVVTDTPKPESHLGTKAAETIEEGDERPDNQGPKKRQPRQPSKKKSRNQQKNDKKATNPIDEGDQETESHVSLKELSPKPPDIPLKGRKKRKTKALSAAEGEKPFCEQPVETPKPERKYSRKKATVQEVDPVLQEEQEKPAAGPEVETSLSGRPRRSAAKTALKYLHSLAQESLDCPEASGSRSGSPDSLSQRPVRSQAGAPRRRKRKRRDSDDPEEDEDFIPGGGDEEMLEDMEDEEEEEAEDLDSELDSATQYLNKSNLLHRRVCGTAANGMTNAIMKPAWDAYTANKKFREEHYSNWVFPEWVPSVSDWSVIPKSELEKYLPQELQSAAFKVSREGLSNEETPLQRLNRFQVSEPHPERLDMVMFAGGPVWALEWCPLPDGATANQYLALACHGGMDHLHVYNQMYGGRGLIQLWDMGRMDYSSRRPEGGPTSLAYGLGHEKGVIWQLKWCPAGAWEPPTCSRKAPFLPRLGLLAVAVSTGVVSIYSLPHPPALCSSLPSEAESQDPPMFQAKEVLTLKLGASKAPHHEKSGQVLCMDWLPAKPHNVMAVGFYDGTVGLWDLASCSSLLTVSDPSHGVTLLPYHCFVAHDNAVRAVCFCPASRHMMATGGNDRMVKLWNLKRLYEPISVQRRNLTTEVCWPLAAPGTFQAQEISYASRGLHGAYFNDLGYRNARSVFIIPRTGTVWSLSISDWCNSLLACDSLGEVIFALLPEFNCTHPSLRRSVERRFPIYFTDMVRYDAEEERSQEEAGGGSKGKSLGQSVTTNNNNSKPAEEEPASSDEEERSPEGGAAQDHVLKMPSTIETYQEAVKKYYLHFSDSNVQSFKNYKKRAPWKHMSQTELKIELDMDKMPLCALHKVRFNPNMSCHAWVASAGQAGLLRLHCLQNMTSSHIGKQVKESETQFSALFMPSDRGGEGGEEGPEEVGVAAADE